MAGVVYLIDTFSLMFQVFHGVPPMTGPSGQPTNAVFGFARDILTLIQQHKPDRLIAAWDAPGRNLREDIYAEYKANRSETPPDLVSQIPVVRETLEAFGVPILEHPGWEADDLIATSTRIAVEQGWQVRIVTSDKDARQLLGPSVQLYHLRKGTYLDEAALLADWGIRPDQVIDFQSLVGDAVDNVPGVPLVGPKKAAQLLQQFETLEAVLANADKAPGAKLKENLVKFADQARMSRELVRLRTDLPLPTPWEQIAAIRPDVPRLQQLFRRLGFRRLVDDVRALSSTAPVMEMEIVVGDDVPSVVTPPAAARPLSAKRRRLEATRSLFGDDDADVALAPPSTVDEPREDAIPEDSSVVRTESVSTSAEHRSSSSDLDWWIVDDEPKFAALLEELRQAKTLSVDLETTGVDPMRVDIVGWAFCWQTGRACYVPVRGPAGEATLDPVDVARRLKPILESPDVVLVNQNIKYDLLAMRRIDIHPKAIGLDSMVGDYLLDAGARSHALDVLSEKYFNHVMMPISELIGSGKNQRTMDTAPIARVAEYASDDAHVAFQLAELLQPQLEDAGLAELYWSLERPLIHVLADMEFAGIRVDPNELRRQSAELTITLEQLMIDIHKLAGREFNIDSPIQLRKILFDELKLPVIKKTKTGPSTDQEVLEELAPLHPLPAKITQHRQLSKLKGTYLDSLPELIHSETGRIHASFNQVVAATGRLSSSDPNLQNIPIRTEEGRRVRRAFIPEHPDWRLLCADYSQIELRILAHYCQDAALCEAFARGEDIHAAVAADVYGVSRSEVTPDMRRVAKAVNFGVIYGQSAYGLSAALGITRDAAAAFIDGYFARFSGVDQFLEQILEECARTGYARTILGRRRPIEGIRAVRNRSRTLPERTAINTVIQGSAADLIKRAMLNVSARLARELPSARMLLQIHDELVFESPAADVPALANIVREEMEGAMTLKVPLVVDVSAGPNWLDTVDLPRE